MQRSYHRDLDTFAPVEKRDIGRPALEHGHENNLTSPEIRRSPKLSNVMLTKNDFLAFPKIRPCSFRSTAMGCSHSEVGGMTIIAGGSQEPAEAHNQELGTIWFKQKL